MRKLNLHRPNATSVIAVTALVFSVTGTSYAAAIVAKNSVKSTSIVDGQVKTKDLGSKAVTGPKLADSAVGSLQLADGSVNGTKLGDGSVANAKLAEGAVSMGKLADGAVAAGKLADGSVATPKLADGAVTTPKVADRSITRGKLAVGATPAFAVVTGSNGVLNRGSADVLGSARTALGTYTVVLDRDVTGCAYLASLGGISNATYDSDVVSAAQEGTDPTKVAVRVTTPAGAAVDHSFHLAVVC